MLTPSIPGKAHVRRQRLGVRLREYRDNGKSTSLDSENETVEI